MARISVTQGVMDITVALTAMDCADCMIVFAVPDRYVKERREDGKAFYCPNGHSLSYKGEISELRRKLREAERDRDWFKNGEQSQRERGDRAERSAAAYKGQTTRLRKRAITGTCAFCHRHFANVERHVASQHPGEQPEATVD